MVHLLLEDEALLLLRQRQQIHLEEERIGEGGGLGQIRKPLGTTGQQEAVPAGSKRLHEPEDGGLGARAFVKPIEDYHEAPRRQRLLQDKDMGRIFALQHFHEQVE